MSDNPKKKKLDGKLVSRRQKHEMEYMKKKHPRMTTRRLEKEIKKSGPSRKKVETGLKKKSR